MISSIDFLHHLFEIEKILNFFCCPLLHLQKLAYSSMFFPLAKCHCVCFLSFLNHLEVSWEQIPRRKFPERRALGHHTALVSARGAADRASSWTWMALLTVLMTLWHSMMISRQSWQQISDFITYHRYHTSPTALPGWTDRDTLSGFRKETGICIITAGWPRLCLITPVLHVTHCHSFRTLWSDTRRD